MTLKPDDLDQITSTYRGPFQPSWFSPRGLELNLECGQKGGGALSAKVSKARLIDLIHHRFLTDHLCSHTPTGVTNLRGSSDCR